jgi:hypothetical protein
MQLSVNNTILDIPNACALIPSKELIRFNGTKLASLLFVTSSFQFNKLLMEYSNRNYFIVFVTLASSENVGKVTEDHSYGDVEESSDPLREKLDLRSDQFYICHPSTINHHENNSIETLQHQIKSPYYTVLKVVSFMDIICHYIFTSSLIVFTTQSSSDMTILKKHPLLQTHQIEPLLTLSDSILLHLENPLHTCHWKIQKWIRDTQKEIYGTTHINTSSNRIWFVVFNSDIDKVISRLSIEKLKDGYEIWDVDTCKQYRNKGFSSMIFEYLFTLYPTSIFYLEIDKTRDRDIVISLIRFYASFSFFILYINDKYIRMKRDTVKTNAQSIADIECFKHRQIEHYTHHIKT